MIIADNVVLDATKSSTSEKLNGVITLSSLVANGNIGFHTRLKKGCNAEYVLDLDGRNIAVVTFIVDEKTGRMLLLQHQPRTGSKSNDQIYGPHSEVLNAEDASQFFFSQQNLLNRDISAFKSVIYYGMFRGLLQELGFYAAGIACRVLDTCYCSDRKVYTAAVLYVNEEHVKTTNFRFDEREVTAAHWCNPTEFWTKTNQSQSSPEGDLEKIKFLESLPIWKPPVQT